MDAPEQSHQDTTYVFAATPTTAPSSGHSNYELTFPCLNLKKMNREEKQQLHQRLYAESVEMMHKFQDLFSATTQSLKQREKSVMELLCNLVGLGPLPPAYKGLNLQEFSNQFPKLMQSKTIDEAMVVIGTYCSFFNFHVIEHIINKLGTRQDMKNLEKYREEFDNYAERHVFECPAEVGMVSEGLANMFVKLDETFDCCTVRGLDLFVVNLRKTLKISTGAVFKLTHITPGCLKLTFQLPYSLIQDIFPLSSEQEAALNGMGVANLWQFNSTKDEEAIEGDSVAIATNQKVNKDKDTASIADSALATASVSGAGTQFSEDIVDRDLRDDPFLRMEHDAAKPRPPDDSSRLELHSEIKVGKSDQITDPDRLFNDLSLHICDKYMQIGLELGLSIEVLTSELEFKMLQERRKALKMLQLWRESVGEHKCTYSVLAAALERHGLRRCAHQYCYDIEDVQRIERGTAKPRPSDVSSRLDLHQASRRGDLDEVKRLVEKKKLNPLEKDDNGDTALHLAAVGGHLDVTKYFIEQQHLNPACLGHHGQTALHVAAQFNHLQVVNYLVAEQHVDPKYQDEYGCTPFHRACLGGATEVINYLVNEMSKLTPLKDVLYHSTKEGQTPLQIAAGFGHLKIVQLFISKYNVDPNTPSRLGGLPLHYAAEGGFLDIVKYLIEEQNTDPSCHDENKATPLHIAAAKGRLDIVKYLTQVKDCNPNTPDQLGRTPLHCAAIGGNLDVAKYLIDENHCNPTCLDTMKLTPLHHASANGHLRIVTYLIKEQHCNPLAYDTVRGTPLHWAAYNDQLFVVKYFVDDLKCPPNIRGPGNTGKTPLEEARAQGHTNVVKYLMSFM